MQLTKAKYPLIALLIAGFNSWTAQAATYKEVGGVVCVEAEHFDSRAKTTDEGDEHAYVLVPDEGPATGTDDRPLEKVGKSEACKPSGKPK